MTTGRRPITLGLNGSSAAAITALGLAIAGCGEPARTAEQQVADTYAQAAAALKAGDGGKFCRTLTKDGQAAIAKEGLAVTGNGDCAATMTRLMTAVAALKAGDWPKFCSSLSQRISSGIAASGAKLGYGTTCAEVATKLAENPKAAAGLQEIGKQFDSQFGRMTQSKLDQVQVLGDRASANLIPPQAGDAPLSFRRTSDGWKLYVTGSGDTSPPGGSSSAAQ